MNASENLVERAERERAFHNQRFAEEEDTRQAEGKYYFALKHGAEAFARRVQELAAGARALEYGCGNASQARAIAAIAKSVNGIDISDVAIENARAAAAGLANLQFDVMNAEAMTFPRGAFDLVFGRGIIHHLDLDKSLVEIARVLAPGGTALFWEPLGHNALINAYRRMTPNARTPDEHPLLARDFTRAREYFETIDVKFYGLTSLATVPFRDTDLGEALLKVSGGLDRALFAIPGLKWQAWHAAIELRQPRHG